MSNTERALTLNRLGEVDGGHAAPKKPRKSLGVLGLFHSRLFGWSAVIALLVLWEWIASVAPSPGLPPPSRIWNSWMAEITKGDLLAQLGETMLAMLYGYAVAAVLGIALGIAMARVKVLYALFEPIVELWRPIPSIIFIPVIILYAGLGLEMNVIVIVIAATESVILNAYGGARSIPPALLDTAATFRLTWWQTLREIVLPAAAPQIFVGLRLALAKSLVLAVGSGMIAGNSGIGFYVINAQQTLDIAKMYAGAATVALTGYALNLLFLFIESRVVHWHAAQRGSAIV
ncbi:ABC transporter permease [Aquabacter sp. CN5-332]|uniref:ABC transporter permease n=1 Tax=Aquabacter sp. CN5-332 TaxID=3156608 RepID=UPI0032B31B56